MSVLLETTEGKDYYLFKYKDSIDLHTNFFLYRGFGN